MEKITINKKEAEMVILFMAIIEEDNNVSHPVKFTSEYKNFLLKINKFLQKDEQR